VMCKQGKGAFCLFHLWSLVENILQWRYKLS